MQLDAEVYNPFFCSILRYNIDKPNDDSFFIISYHQDPHFSLKHNDRVQPLKGDVSFATLLVEKTHLPFKCLVAGGKHWFKGSNRVE